MSRDFDQVLLDVNVGDLPRRRVCQVEPGTPLGEVYRLLDEENSVAVLICDGPSVVGIFTERDILYRTALEGGLETPIGELMTRDVVTLPSDAKLVEAIRTMAEKGIRHIPVLRHDSKTPDLVGGRDVLKMIAEYYPQMAFNLPPHLHQKMTTAEGG